MTKLFSELLKALPAGTLVSYQGDVAVTAPVVEADHDLSAGGVFVARSGLNVDGHDFIPAAIERGAVAIVGERAISGLAVPYAQVTDAQLATGYLAAAYHDFPSQQLTVIGVTGTDGKTSTSTLIHAILQATMGHKAGLICTVNADLGGVVSDTGLHVTTPGAPQTQELLARMVANGLSHCVLEMTSHGLAQGRLNGVKVNAAVMTNVNHEHLDYHGSFEAYRAAKGRLFALLTESETPQWAVVNADDPSADYFAEQATGQHIVRYGINAPADYRAENIDYGPQQTRFTVNGQVYAIALAGSFNVYNALAAIALADRMGIDPVLIQQGLESVLGIPGRMERLDEGQNFTAMVDFAHTPNALKNVIHACREMLQGQGRLIVVFGSAGLRDREKRRMMAETAVQLADLSIFTAEDPRTESLEGILQVMADAAIAQGGVEGRDFLRVPDRGEALYQACQLAQAGDIVVACGKGHEQSMCFGTVEYPWDDRDALRDALRGQARKTLPTAQTG
jgi:UDP-N-acetylmuramoyl-L-alanyl-D-glutamate--2,6-diaminopimelate ligase